MSCIRTGNISKGNIMYKKKRNNFPTAHLFGCDYVLPKTSFLILPNGKTKHLRFHEDRTGVGGIDPNFSLCSYCLCLMYSNSS
jgi:hypothetical protein